MLTFFTTAKPFQGHSGIIQRNALKSWKLLHPEIEIILFGDEGGTAEVCAELGLRHEPHVERCPTGQKYIRHLFSRAQEIARNEFLCYSNCDIVLMSDFWAAFERVRQRNGRFLLIGKRWDTDLTESLNVKLPAWEERLRAIAVHQGRQRYYEIDYFLFPRGLFADIPPLVNGRIYWDHWLVWKARSLSAPVIDASHAVMAVHQNHDYGYHAAGKDGVFEDEISRRNYELAGNGKHLCTYEDATHIMTRSGLLLRTPWRKKFHEAKRLSFHIFVHKTLPIRKAIGLRKESLRKLFSRDSMT